MNIMKLTEINNTLGDSWLLGCKFYKTDLEGIFVTDYDINNHESLKEKNLHMAFNRKTGDYIYISNQLINDGSGAFRLELIRLKNGIDTLNYKI